MYLDDIVVEYVDVRAPPWDCGLTSKRESTGKFRAKPRILLMLTSVTLCRFNDHAVDDASHVHLILYMYLQMLSLLTNSYV